MFGGRGATDFITRATMVLGAAFFITSLTLALMSTGPRRARSRSLIQERGAPRLRRPRRRPAPGDASRRRAAGAAGFRQPRRRAARPRAWSGVPRSRTARAAPARRTLDARSYRSCPGGGIGRHVRLRGVWGNPCEFKSRPGHHETRTPRALRVAFVVTVGAPGRARAVQSARRAPSRTSPSSRGRCSRPRGARSRPCG